MLVAVLLLGLATAGQAHADSVSISVTDTTGQADPVAGAPRLFTVSGTTTLGTAGNTVGLYVKYRAPGGSPCAPAVDSDPGSFITSDGRPSFGRFGGGIFDGDSINGSFDPAFSFKESVTWRTPGTFVFCIWIAHHDQEPVTPVTQTITFRPPNATIGATVAPSNPGPGQQATVTIYGSSEASKNVYARIRPADGRPCGASYSADGANNSGESLVSGESVNGNFSVPATTTQSTAGTYLICLWLADSQEDVAPIAGPQPLTFTVGRSSACIAATSAESLALRRYRSAKKTASKTAKAAKKAKKTAKRASGKRRKAAQRRSKTAQKRSKKAVKLRTKRRNELNAATANRKSAC